jgi:hypothetical protein
MSDPDFLFRLAIDFVITERKATTRFLQDRFGIGYHSAVLLIARLEGEGIIGPPDADGGHEVLTSSDDQEEPKLELRRGRTDPTVHAEDRARRHEARDYYLSAPPYCIQFASDGTAQLCQKEYEFWPDRSPEEATTWRVLSSHANLEEAERRLKFIVGGPVYYDAEGRVVRAKRRPTFGMPPSDDD